MISKDSVGPNREGLCNGNKRCHGYAIDEMEGKNTFKSISLMKSKEGFSIRATF